MIIQHHMTARLGQGGNLIRHFLAQLGVGIGEKTKRCDGVECFAAKCVNGLPAIHRLKHNPLASAPSHGQHVIGNIDAVELAVG